MTKRIVSGIFILTALGALGVILAGALTSGEQLIVRFLTAVIVAALGLYVISDLRLQADDDALSGRGAGQGRVGKVDAPPNSTAAFMATVTKKVDPRSAVQATEIAGAPLQVGDGVVPQPANRQQRERAGLGAEAAETTVVSAETLDAVSANHGGTNGDSPANQAGVNGTKQNGKQAKRPVVPVASKKPKNPQQIPAVIAKLTGTPDSSIPAGAETVVASSADLAAASGHAMAGVGAVASASNGNGDGHEADGASPASEPVEPAGEDFLGSQSIDISDLFADEGAKANLANGNGGGANGNGTNGANGNGSINGSGSANGVGSSTNGTHHSNGSTNGSNGSANGTNGGDGNGSASNGHWANDHISGRLSEATGVDAAALDAATEFDPAERVYDLEGLDAASVTGETNGAASKDFEYSDDLHSGDYVWPAAPATSAPEPHPFEKASAAYEAAKRKLEEVESVETTPSNVKPFSGGGEIEAAADDAPLAPIIDLRELVEPGESDVDAAINAGEVEVIATLIEQGMLSTSGPISDSEVRTMVYVAFTSNELRKLLLAGGSPDGPNYGLDLGPVELFDERVHAPAPKRLYSGAPTPQPTSQIG